MLASGESEVKYSGRANGADTIWLDVNTVCQSGSRAKEFVGWRLKNNDTEYQVGDRLDWLSTLLSADNCYYSSNCNRLVFEAIYELHENKVPLDTTTLAATQRMTFSVIICTHL